MSEQIAVLRALARMGVVLVGTRVSNLRGYLSGDRGVVIKVLEDGRFCVGWPDAKGRIEWLRPAHLSWALLVIGGPEP